MCYLVCHDVSVIAGVNSDVITDLITHGITDLKETRDQRPELGTYIIFKLYLQPSRIPRGPEMKKRNKQLDSLVS